MGRPSKYPPEPLTWARRDSSRYSYLRAPYYDPNTGQFLTRDPIEPITRSAYGYAYNNPLNATDPTGLGAFEDLIGAFVDFVGHDPGKAGTLANLALCLGGLTLCGAATMLGVAARSFERSFDYGFRDRLRENAMDAFMAFAISFWSPPPPRTVPSRRR